MYKADSNLSVDLLKWPGIIEAVVENLINNGLRCLSVGAVRITHDTEGGTSSNARLVASSELELSVLQKLIHHSALATEH